MIKQFAALLDWIIFIILDIGVLIILAGVGLTLYNLILNKILDARRILSSYLLLGLEFFIAADIIRTIISPTWQDIGILASIVGIRTVLSYFLRMEIKEST